MSISCYLLWHMGVQSQQVNPRSLNQAPHITLHKMLTETNFLDAAADVGLLIPDDPLVTHGAVTTQESITQQVLRRGSWADWTSEISNDQGTASIFKVLAHATRPNLSALAPRCALGSACCCDLDASCAPVMASTTTYWSKKKDRVSRAHMWTACGAHGTWAANRRGIKDVCASILTNGLNCCLRSLQYWSTDAYLPMMRWDLGRRPHCSQRVQDRMILIQEGGAGIKDNDRAVCF